MERHRVFGALSNKIRLKIIEEARRGEVRPQMLEEKLKITRSGLERHLKVLLHAGLIKKVVYLEEGKPRLKYVLSPSVGEFLRSLDNSMGLFQTVLQEKSNEERVAVLKLEIQSVEETLKKIDVLKDNGSLSVSEHERLWREYQAKLSGLVSELLTVI